MAIDRGETVPGPVKRIYFESAEMLTRDEVLRRAKEILGDQAGKWLHSAIPALGGQIPAVMIETKEGCEQVLDELGRISPIT